jgi:hypothetical protein
VALQGEHFPSRKSQLKPVDFSLPFSALSPIISTNPFQRRFPETRFDFSAIAAGTEH